ncbi:uncharacterized protein ATNIH1004_003888 [Aspergillus tanneri]|uniref:Uncharacterized protein n=1 Tax=Aspergillus tanneri TaxID=1220188 RepID=A0A5M9MLW5_9EURO|nr:uncharacterized protein ATNIH1004_003888 [Aspergillus tanneri]KAA8648005.1 hypothetical protein ATNIH1004_003888 [Aspergillus tanneri]
MKAVFSGGLFACFVVLAGNAVALSSTEDLALLSSISAVEHIAASSSSEEPLSALQALLQIACFSVARQTAVSRASTHSHPPAEATPVFNNRADVIGKVNL